MERGIGASDGGGGMGTGYGSMEWESNGMDQWSYGPGMRLDVSHFPYLDIESSANQEGEGVKEDGVMKGAPAVKRPCLSSRAGFQGCAVQFPSSQILRNTGGKGYQRARTKKVLEGPSILL